ncbi:hypothetical protein N656DRAFT_52642 [Canariomyces notabilis]|uniref:Uncharacterized protein n=1 Tax=Canariomyces notabilis TaxID=2074819 RepID=A0AAN6TNF1_9PEZI|nr:hypothetical protein N656DRAFT_52642 [Canariomyces arenarius]
MCQPATAIRSRAPSRGKADIGILASWGVVQLGARVGTVQYLYIRIYHTYIGQGPFELARSRPNVT